MLFVLSWYGRHLLAPLIPFAIGFVVRWAVNGAIGVNCVGLEELSFSMGSLTLLMLLSSEGAIAKKDPRLAQQLRPLLWILLSFFAGAFALSCYFDATIDTAVPIIMTLGGAPHEAALATLAETIGRISTVETPLPIVRSFILVFGAVTLLTAIILKERFNLTD